MSHPESVHPVRSRLEPVAPDGTGEPVERVPASPLVSLPPTMSLDDRLIQIESGLISWALSLTGGNKTRAAEILKIKRSTLGDRITRCRLNGYDL